MDKFRHASIPHIPSPILVLLQLFRPNLVGHGARPRNEHGKARTPGPHPLRGYPAYIPWYVAGSALGGQQRRQAKLLGTALGSHDEPDTAYELPLDSKDIDRPATHQVRPKV